MEGGFPFPPENRPSNNSYNVCTLTVTDLAMAENVSLRAANSEDIEQICRVDTDASSKFGTIPALADLADGSHGPLDSRTVKDWLVTGTVYVAEIGKEMLGFTAIQPKDGVLYIAELSVLASQQGRGIGSQLLNKSFEHARQKACDDGIATAKVSLTTYPDVPWNGPWYRKRGFEEVAPESVGSWHVEKARRDDEDLARPGYRRCCMLREEAIDLSYKA